MSVGKSPAMRTAQAPARKATNVTLPKQLVAEARELGVSLSQACERGLAAAVAERRAQRWLESNQAGIEAWNKYVEENGLPLTEFRRF